ncbi:cytochrome-c oxidase [Cytobacillus sp. Hz8]|uniref:cytochrome-c oxidase n=1 Tax=Cytobacillus sp. Hz8 TaxID=3347168 RepID=UPI0035E3034C
MGIRLIKISVVYFIIGICIGLYMSIAHSYTLAPVHTHINLLGWTALTLAGIIYHLFPKLATTVLAKTHFWLHNIALPVMMIGLAFVVNENEDFVSVVAAGGTVLVIAIILFGLNILIHLKSKDETL